jgi:copper chaperone
MERVDLTIEGMTCEHCVRAVRQRLQQTDGVEVENVLVGSATIRMDPARVTMDGIEEAIADEGYTAYRSEPG